MFFRQLCVSPDDRIASDFSLCVHGLQLYSENRPGSELRIFPFQRNGIGALRRSSHPLVVFTVVYFDDFCFHLNRPG
jgi:hypothetical protein